MIEIVISLIKNHLQIDTDIHITLIQVFVNFDVELKNFMVPQAIYLTIRHKIWMDT